MLLPPNHTIKRTCACVQVQAIAPHSRVLSPSPTPRTPAAAAVLRAAASAAACGTAAAQPRPACPLPCPQPAQPAHMTCTDAHATGREMRQCRVERSAIRKASKQCGRVTVHAHLQYSPEEILLLLTCDCGCRCIRQKRCAYLYSCHSAAASVRCSPAAASAASAACLKALIPSGLLEDTWGSTAARYLRSGIVKCKQELAGGC
jgi:hypothetical protein